MHMQICFQHSALNLDRKAKKFLVDLVKKFWL